MQISKYITNLITEKGVDATDTIELDGHFGFTYEMLIDTVATQFDRATQFKVWRTLVTIDARNGDVFHFLTYIARGIVGGV